jgi:DASH complex subunit DAM1
MTEFLEEAEALQTNIEGMKHLSDSLSTFNESFASWLYVMNMNALTTDWIQVRISFSLDRPRLTSSGTDTRILRTREETRRCASIGPKFRVFNVSFVEESAVAAAEALKKAREEEEKARQARHLADQTAFTEMTDTTYLGNLTTATGTTAGTTTSGKSGAVPKKKPGAKPKLSAKERKERSVSRYDRRRCRCACSNYPTRWKLSELCLACPSSSVAVIQYVLVNAFVLPPLNIPARVCAETWRPSSRVLWRPRGIP